MGDRGIGWLTKLFNSILKTKRKPDENKYIRACARVRVRVRVRVCEEKKYFSAYIYE